MPPAAGGEGDCDDASGNCDSFKLTISGTAADWAAANKQVHVQINWNSPSTDYDLYVHKGTIAGPVVASSGSGGTTSEQVDLNPSSSSIGTGDFVVRVVYFLPNPADQYSGVATIKATSTGPAPIPAPTPATSRAPRFENFTPPFAGPATLGRSAGGPSIGVGLGIAGHQEGRALFQADVQTLRVTFNGCASPLWENKPAPTSQQDFDPIFYTDRATGRSIVHLLTFAGNVIAGESSVTDTAPPENDGDIWLPSKGSGIGSGVDHQTVGGGPFRNDLTTIPPVVAPPHPTYPDAVYYCSQALVDASCAVSLDGGINYGASTVTYSSECGGLHGHIKVGPDGVAYLPNKGCGTEQAVVVSEDNGTTCNIRPIPGSVSAGSDPAVGVDGGNKVYFGYANGDTKAVVSTSTDHGKTWGQPLDVGAAFGINNVVFPAVIAGDKDRAVLLSSARRQQADCRDQNLQASGISTSPRLMMAALPGPQSMPRRTIQCSAAVSGSGAARISAATCSTSWTSSWIRKDASSSRMRTAALAANARKLGRAASVTLIPRLLPSPGNPVVRACSRSSIQQQVRQRPALRM